MAICIAVFLIFAGVGWALWHFGGQSAALMAQGAVQVVAKVEGLEVERRTSNRSSDGISRSRTTYSYHADLSFADQAGRAQRTRVSVSEVVYNRLQRGQDLPLRYAAADPSVVELHEGDLAAGSTIGYWIMLGGLVGVAGTLVVAFVRRRRPAVL
jgi:hypothetical protein